MSTALAKRTVIRVPVGAIRLPDNAQWKNRFQIKSETSSRIYIISQNKNSGLYGCSCPGFASNRRCKHLERGCGLPLTMIHGRNQFEEKKRERLSS